MSLQSRLNLLFLGLILSSVVAALIANRTERSEQEHLSEAAGVLLQQNSAHWLELSSEGMRQFAEDYSWWDEMVRFVTHPDPAWAETNFEDMLDFWHVSGVWVFDRVGRESYHLTHQDHPNLRFPLDSNEIWDLTRVDIFPHFMKKTEHGWLELRGAPIQPGDDQERTSQAQGWFFVGRVWDETYFNLIRPSSAFSFSLHNSGKPVVPLNLNQISAAHPLLDERDQRIGSLIVTRHSPEITQWTTAGVDETLLWGLFGVVVVGATALSIHFWIKRPLRATLQALNSNETAPLRHLAESDHEFGRIARLMSQALDQKAELELETERRSATEIALRQSEESLQQALKERTQLGLDLHDSTIQVLYASGLSLSAVESQLADQPEDICRKLSDIRRNLQLAVDDLRQFIAASEDHSHDRSFRESIDGMLALMRDSNQIQIHSQIDDGVADHLNPHQCINLLQIMREGMANALRHSRAHSLWVEVKVRPKLVRLLIQDDGIGYQSAVNKQNSMGLSNMKSRAEAVGAVLKICERPEGGTRIDLQFNTP